MGVLVMLHMTMILEDQSVIATYRHTMADWRVVVSDNVTGEEEVFIFDNDDWSAVLALICGGDEAPLTEAAYNRLEGFDWIDPKFRLIP